MPRLWTGPGPEGPRRGVPARCRRAQAPGPGVPQALLTKGGLTHQGGALELPEHEVSCIRPRKAVANEPVTQVPGHDPAGLGPIIEQGRANNGPITVGFADGLRGGNYVFIGCAQEHPGKGNGQPGPQGRHILWVRGARRCDGNDPPDAELPHGRQDVLGPVGKLAGL